MTPIREAGQWVCQRELFKSLLGAFALGDIDVRNNEQTLGMPMQGRPRAS
jgi:hypothetical protein